MPAFLELIMDQGTDFSRDIALSDDITGGNINVVNYTVKCNARKSYTSYSSNTSQPDVIFTTTILDGPNGVIRISQTSANTANYYPRRYWYDILTIGPTGLRTRVLEGTLTVTPSVS
jgi:hypothetical protein